MTNDLYRKEALEHRSRSLYGEVVLTSPPGMWILTFILAAVMAFIGGLLFFGQVHTDDGTLSIIDWFMSGAP